MTMTHIHGWISFDDQDNPQGGTSWSAWNAPSNTSDEQIEAWIDECFPAEHCTHDHDCCGNRYHRRANWSVHIDARDARGNGTKVIILSRLWIFNI